MPTISVLDVIYATPYHATESCISPKQSTTHNINADVLDGTHSLKHVRTCGEITDITPKTSSKSSPTPHVTLLDDNGA
jgi:hypothetical protein